ERRFGLTYKWNERNREKAAELDFVRRAAEIARMSRQAPALFIVGEDDDSAFKGATRQLYEALGRRYDTPDSLSFETVPGLAHGLADEPGIEPAPQTPGAMRVDEIASAWLSRHLGD